jgi:CBS domain-containing protein
MDLKNTLQTIEDGNLGFCLVVDNNDKLAGIVSSADIRKGVLKNLVDLNALDAKSIMNANPVTIFETSTVVELLQTIKKCAFPVMYLPVLKNDGKAAGIVNFVHLIKGEL